jgi:hypothetical protein
LGRVVEEGAEVGAFDEFHGEEERAVFSGFQIAAVNDVVVANLTEHADFAQEAVGEGLVAAQLRGEKFEGAGLVHEDVLGKVDGSHAALAEFADDEVALMNDHARLEVADLVEQHTVRGAGGVAVGIAGRALRAVFHAFIILG